MYRILICVALVGILGTANARDGTQTPSPPNVGPLPPGLFAQAPDPAKAQSLKEQLVGAWELASCNTRQLYCVKPHGIMILSASGYYTIIHLKGDRPKVANQADTWPAEEWKALAIGNQVNFGTWSVDEATKTMTWHINGAFNPNNEGNDFKGTLSLSGDDLGLIAVGEPPRPIPTPQVWRRIGK
jgi:hypothetical protein